MEASPQQVVQRKYEILGAIFDEGDQPLWVATEASELGRGGVYTIARATGLSRTTIYQSLAERRGGEPPRATPANRVRAPGRGDLGDR